MVCVCVLREQSNSERERERQTESVCLDQLHSKSVYSAQFGIKHNRLLSACYCLWCPWWCPIKMEFIAALRASPNYIFPSALRPPPSLFCTFSFSHGNGGWWHRCRVFFVLTSSSGCQTSRQNGSLQTPNGQYGWHAHLPVSPSLLYPVSSEWAARINHIEDSWHTSWMWWHLMQLSPGIPTNLQMLKEFFHSFTSHSQASHLVERWRRKKTFLSFADSACYVAIFRQFNVTSLFQLHPDDRQK